VTERRCDDQVAPALFCVQAALAREVSATFHIAYQINVFVDFRSMAISAIKS